MAVIDSRPRRFWDVGETFLDSAGVSFADFQLNATTGELKCGMETLQLQDQPLQVLLTLLEQRGELVTRQQLVSRLWTPDTGARQDTATAAGAMNQTPE